VTRHRPAEEPDDRRELRRGSLDELERDGPRRPRLLRPQGRWRLPEARARPLGL